MTVTRTAGALALAASAAVLLPAAASACERPTDDRDVVDADVTAPVTVHAADTVDAVLDDVL